MADRQFKCTMCGASGELGCDHGKGAYQPLSYFVTEALKATPKKSNYTIAKELGCSEFTVRQIRNQLRDNIAVEAGAEDQLRDNIAVEAGTEGQVQQNIEPEKRLGRDNKWRRVTRRATHKPKTRAATPQEAVDAGFKPTGESRVILETGKVVGKFKATKLETEAAATQDSDALVAELKAEIAELKADNEQLRYELTQKPTIYDLRRTDAIANHTQRITTDIDTYNLFRRCLHPDSRSSVSDGMLHDAWLAFRNLEQLTYDKTKIAPPLPKDLNELLRQRYDVMTRKRTKSKAS